MSYYRQRKV